MQLDTKFPGKTKNNNHIIDYINELADTDFPGESDIINRLSDSLNINRVYIKTLFPYLLEFRAELTTISRMKFGISLGWGIINCEPLFIKFQPMFGAISFDDRKKTVILRHPMEREYALKNLAVMYNDNEISINITDPIKSAHCEELYKFLDNVVNNGI